MKSAIMQMDVLRVTRINRKRMVLMQSLEPVVLDINPKILLNLIFILAFTFLLFSISLSSFGLLGFRVLESHQTSIFWCNSFAIFVNLNCRTFVLDQGDIVGTRHSSEGPVMLRLVRLEDRTVPATVRSAAGFLFVSDPTGPVAVTVLPGGAATVNGVAFGGVTAGIFITGSNAADSISLNADSGFGGNVLVNALNGNDVVPVR